MRHVVGFARFWYDFVVGDDWTIAVVVILAVVLTDLLVRAGYNAWYFLPVAIGAALTLSVLRAEEGRPPPPASRESQP
ncbi:MAG TPA: hypothetical protein VGH94_07175 [Acidimicrobiales bacterium]|jgi:hypothetical protein